MLRLANSSSDRENLSDQREHDAGKDVAFACERFRVSEHRACKLMRMDRCSYRYELRPDRNAELREALVTLAGQKPRYGYRRLRALPERPIVQPA